MANPYIIRNQGQRETRNGQYRQTTINIHRADDTDISFDELFNFTQKAIGKKKEEQRLMIRALTPMGWMTYKGYNDDIINIMNEEEYLNGRVSSDTKFSDSISQFQIIISQFN